VTVPRQASDSRDFMDHCPSAREGNPEQATNAIGHPCRHGAKEQLSSPVARTLRPVKNIIAASTRKTARALHK
jgi:hypothetical protein